MTVKELIERLINADKEKDVCVCRYMDDDGQGVCVDIVQTHDDKDMFVIV